jgi:hypothetical protein
LFTQPPATASISATTATITWQSNERSTSYVEYGVGTAGYVAGDNVLTTQHSVTLSNLAPGTRYVWRVRSSDAFRNVAHTELFSFATTSADAVTAPILIPASAEVERGTYTTTVPLSWYQVVAPSGSAVQYEVQLASDPAFSYLVNASMAGPGVPGLTIGDSGWISGAPTSYGGRPAVTYPATVTNIPQDDCFEVVAADYYWRVRARDQNAHVSDWSDTGYFGAIAVAPWCY